MGLPNSAVGGLGLLAPFIFIDNNGLNGPEPLIAGFALVGVGGFTILDASTRRNHKYQSDVYFEVLVSSYNNYTSRRFQR